MTKDSQPKAINIVRPGTFMGPKRMGGGSSVHSGSVHSGSVISTSSTASARKPRVTNKIESTKPTINLYHPPSRKPSEDSRITGRTLYNTNSIPPPAASSQQYQQLPQQQQQQQPHYQLQQQQQQHYYNNGNHQQQIQPLQPQRMTKSFTAPSLQTSHEPTRSLSPSSNIIRPHRSVLSPITATSNNIHTEPDEGSLSSSDEEQISDIDEDDSPQSTEEDDDIDDDEDDENTPRNKARVNRQIEDLEISNQSLLTVNAMLESTVRKQASELAQFKKLMASGELPQQDLIIPVPPIAAALDQNENDDDDSSDDWEKDETFQKLKKVTEMMIEQGQKAINFEYKILGRVLADYQLDEEEEEEEEEEEVDK